MIMTTAPTGQNIAPVMNNALPGAGRGCQTFTGPQRISRCSIRENGECTKGENRQEAKHRQISFDLDHNGEIDCHCQKRHPEPKPVLGFHVWRVHFPFPFSPISTSRRSRNFLMPNQVDSENTTALPAASTRAPTPGPLWELAQTNCDPDKRRAFVPQHRHRITKLAIQQKERNA